MGSAKSILDVAEQHMCSGCGVCAYLAPDAIRMVDDVQRGRRPLVEGQASQATREAFEACPGHSLAHPAQLVDGYIQELAAEWGPVLEVWEGFASDDELRFAASSGGAASALALFGIEREKLHGLLHIKAREDTPWLNETVLSQSREDLLAATGSRYASASPCDGLQQVEDAPAPSIFVGKPCDVAGTHAARKMRPGLDQKLAITIGIFCAGAPSADATRKMIEDFGIDDLESVLSVRYRGLGWPGNARVETKDGRVEETTYAASWNKLQRGRPWRCYVCPDHTGEFADLAVGDPWYRKIPEGEPGRSLILVRTERGRRFLKEAVAAGYLKVEPREPQVLVDSQPGLLHTRGAIWGRMLITRILGAGTPRFTNMPMFPTWLRLTWRQKLSSLAGTWRRVFRKRLRHRTPIREWKP